MFGTRIRALRTQKDMTQEELGKLLGVGKATVSQYESETRTPDAATFRRIADIFEVSVDYLLGRTDDPRGAQADDEERSRELDELLADEEIHLNGEPLTIEEKEALLAVIKMIKRNKAARQKSEKQDSTPK